MAMEGIQSFSSEKVRLDVGGRCFSTTITTLTSEPESLLWSMFSGRFVLNADPVLTAVAAGCYLLRVVLSFCLCRTVVTL